MEKDRIVIEYKRGYMRFNEVWILRFGDIWNGFRVVLDGDLRGKMRVC